MGRGGLTSNIPGNVDIIQELVRLPKTNNDVVVSTNLIYNLPVCHVISLVAKELVRAHLITVDFHGLDLFLTKNRFRRVLLVKKEVEAGKSGSGNTQKRINAKEDWMLFRFTWRLLQILGYRFSGIGLPGRSRQSRTLLGEW